MIGGNTIFVFGSNLAGRHGKGAAYTAHQRWGAIYGQGIGIQGSAYAIPTKDGRRGADLKDRKQILPLEEIAKYVSDFKVYAREHMHLNFIVTNIGCGNSRYSPEQIAPLFRGSPENCKFSTEFQEAMR